jgi:lipoprotein Spr
MLKQATLYSIMIVLLASCASLKTAFTGNKSTASSSNSSAVKKESKFLDQIDVPVESSKGEKEKEKEKESAKKETSTTRNSTHRESMQKIYLLYNKYAVLLSTQAEEVKNTKMFEFIDDWYGHPIVWEVQQKRSRLLGIFPISFASVYGLSIPRTAREQYNLTSRISRTQLIEGD